MDVKETSPYFAIFGHTTHRKRLSAFTGSRRSADPVTGVDSLPDSSVLAAVVENAVVTTMVTSEGKSLTEIKLTIKNQAQPFSESSPAGRSEHPVSRGRRRKGQARPGVRWERVPFVASGIPSGGAV